MEEVILELKETEVLPFTYMGEVWSGNWEGNRSAYHFVNEEWKKSKKSSKAISLMVFAPIPFPYEDDFSGKEEYYGKLLFGDFCYALHGEDYIG